MDSHEIDPPAPGESCRPGVWSQKYGERHALVRVTDFPAGIVAPKRVRLYLRAGHYVLQWWDPAAKATLSDRIDGDLVAAIMRARQIEERLTHFRRSGQGVRRLGHADLVERFMADLERRADAGAIDPSTRRRYGSALAHYEAFVGQAEVRKAFPFVAGVDREFRLAFAAFLANRRISPNGNPVAAARPMKGRAFVLDTARAMLEWAADPERGGLLPDGFRNPFRGSGGSRDVLGGDPLAAPDITAAMAVDFVGLCDPHQLRLFVPMMLFGLRAAEPCFLFVEYLDPAWLRVPCNPDLGYRTKGRRDKRFPLIDELRPFWGTLADGRPHGLLVERRSVAQGGERAPWRGASLAELIVEFRRRCAAPRSPDAARRLELRGELLREAGGVDYDQIGQEFGKVARRLSWPRRATLKDFRHLFCTMMASACLPEVYRRYLMGHAPERAAIAAYTHLSDLPRHYAEALRREGTPLIDAILERVRALRGG
jgi:hypothetical protein